MTPKNYHTKALHSVIIFLVANGTELSLLILDQLTVFWYVKMLTPDDPLRSLRKLFILKNWNPSLGSVTGNCSM